MRLPAFICLASLPLTAATAEERTSIAWDAARPLVWEDFAGSVPRNADASRVAATHASLAWSYRYEISRSRGECAYRIEALESAAAFHPEQSWVREGHRTPRVLQHEQVHFDITRLFQLRFEGATRGLVGVTRPCRGQSERRSKAFVEDDIDRVVGSVYRETWRSLIAEQAAYDAGTRHGIDANAQSAWTRRIAEQLAAHAATAMGAR